MDFWEIYDEYYPRVRKFVLALVRDAWMADDLIQETFMRVQANLASLRDPSKISSWIFRIAYNVCQDHLRGVRASRMRENADRNKPELLHDASLQHELEQRQMGDCVQQQMSLVPEPLRTVIVLFDIMEFSHQEVAEILGVSVPNVKVRLYRARKKLRSILEEKCTFSRDERNVLVCEPQNPNGS